MLRILNSKEIYCKTTHTINVGGLMIPRIFKRHCSMFAEGDPGMCNHPHAVKAHVSWPVTEDEVDAGIEKELHCIDITVVPEFKVPKPAVAGEDIRWTPHDAAYPFWGIQRQRMVNEEWNCEIRPQDVTVVVACTNANAAQFSTDA